jgi:tyrosinase
LLLLALNRRRHPESKNLLKAGENPDVIRHALGIYLTHSRDAQRRKIVVPPLKNHALFLSQRTAAVAAATAKPSELKVVAGEVVSPDTMQGAALLSYWREDYDCNDHHVHWHMVFPCTGMVVNGANVKVIDRQGELFLYMHSQMVARYEAEGLCWNMPLVRPWNQYDDVLESGYVPVLALIEFYGGYPPFSSWFATKNPNIPDIKDQSVPRELLETWRDNIYQGIMEG